MIKEMTNKKYSHVMIIEDFNYPDISLDTATSEAAEDSPTQGLLSTTAMA